MHGRKLITLLVLAISTSLCASPEFEEGIYKAQILETSQGHLLRYTRFESPVEVKKGHVVFIQGRGTFLEFYEVLIDPLLERGYDVWTYDLTGQGGSSRLPLEKDLSPLTKQRMQHIDSFGSYLLDMHEFIQKVVLPKVGDDRLLLGGYSKGGHLALRYLQSYPENSFKGAFAISPLLSLKLPIYHTAVSGSLYLIGALFSDLNKYVPGAGDVDPIFAMTFTTNPYTSDPERFQEMVRLCEQYPDWMMGGVSVTWLRAAIESVFALWKPDSLQAIQIPVLISTGLKDGVVDVSYNAQFVEELSHGKHLVYPTGRHELFRETPAIRDNWWREFDLFFSSSDCQDSGIKKKH